jgi:hypothetical protein
MAERAHTRRDRLDLFANEAVGAPAPELQRSGRRPHEGNSGSEAQIDLIEPRHDDASRLRAA